MIARPDRSRMSVEDYLRLDEESAGERYEYIDGYAYMLAGGTADHAKISANMIRELSIALRESPCSVYTSDLKILLADKRRVYPDVSVSCDARDGGTRDFLEFPRLVVEVLSPSTEAYDRSQKFDYYRECSTLEEYVLIETQRQAVDIYRRAKGDLWTLHFFRTGDTLELTSLNVSFPLSALYQNVALLLNENKDE